MNGKLLVQCDVLKADNRFCGCGELDVLPLGVIGEDNALHCYYKSKNPKIMQAIIIGYTHNYFLTTVHYHKAIQILNMSDS